MVKNHVRLGSGDFLMNKEKKKIIFIKSTGSDIFEEAYFVLKSTKFDGKYRENLTRDMVQEANRVIDEKIGAERKRRLILILSALGSFIFGAFLSLTVACVLILCLI